MQIDERFKRFSKGSELIQSAKTEAEKRISDLESQSAMFKKKMHLGIDHHVSISSKAGIGSIFL